jgi:hypothetical protein
MFERFTDRARRIVVWAQEEARTLEHDHVGTEHVLLGLIHEGAGVAVRVLESLEIGPEAVRQRVEEVIGRGDHAPSGHIPFTPRAKVVLKLALQESRQLGHDYIGTEHILLGLISEGDGVAARVLRDLGADLSRARELVVQILDKYRRQHGQRTGLHGRGGSAAAGLCGPPVIRRRRRQFAALMTAGLARAGRKAGGCGPGCLGVRLPARMGIGPVDQAEPEGEGEHGDDGNDDRDQERPSHARFLPPEACTPCLLSRRAQTGQRT